MGRKNKAYKTEHKSQRRGKYDEERNYNPYLTQLDYELDKWQKEYQKAINKFPVVFVDEPSGTGKTTVAVERGFDFLRKGISQKILYVRFTDDRYLKNGFLPGDLEEKTVKLFRPFMDAIAELNVSEDTLKKLIEREQVELTTDSAWRGGNLKNTFMIIDEAQNARDISDLQLMLTRLHDEGGRGVVIGHSGQQDNKKFSVYGGYSPFQVYAIHMAKKPWTKIVHLENNYRGEISKWADYVWETVEELRNRG